MTWKSFEEIEAWQMARALNQEIHHLIQTTDLQKNFALKDQLSRAAGSVMDNIAEGFERSTHGEFKTFLGYAKGSCGEVKSQLYRCLDYGIIDHSTFEKLKHDIDFISGKLFRLIQYLQSTHDKGKRLTQE